MTDTTTPTTRKTVPTRWHDGTWGIRTLTVVKWIKGGTRCVAHGPSGTHILCSIQGDTGSLVPMRKLTDKERAAI